MSKYVINVMNHYATRIIINKKCMINNINTIKMLKFA